jgi:hypothetical protein
MKLSFKFVSKAFPPEPGEDVAVNPGRYGKRLAHFLTDQLSARGQVIVKVAPEDWGWRIDMRNDEFRLWIGCGNLDEVENGFLCFVEPRAPKAGQWFKRTSTRQKTEQLAEELYEVLAANASIEQLAWTD